MVSRTAWRTAVLLPALVGAAARLPAQDFEGIITARVPSVAMGGEMKIYLKGGKSRVELPGPQGQMAVIADPEKGETYLVMPAQSTYMVIKNSDMEQMADAAVQRADPGGESSATPTGKRETIAGHSCEIYRVKGRDSEVDACLAKGIGNFRANVGLFNGPPLPGRQRPAPTWARELLEQGAFPLRVTDTKGTVLWEVVALEPKGLEAALFVPPANFQRMAMPFGRPPGD